MKKYILLAMSVAVFGFTSCTEDQMDDVNKNYENPSAEIISADIQLTDAIMATGYYTTSGDYAFYTSSFTEQEFGTGDNQLADTETRNSIQVSSTSTYNNVWNGAYANLLNIKEIIEKVDNNTANSGSMLDVKGAAEVLWVINFGILTDMHGDIPYSEALQGSDNITPHADSQEDIYASLMTMIDQAITDLQTAVDEGCSTAGSHDIAFYGDVNSWLATAYAIKARYAIHQICKGEKKYAQLAYDAAVKAEDLGFDGCLITEFNGETCDNPWSAYIWSRSYTAPCSTVTDLMGSNDPRLNLYMNGKDPNAQVPKQSYNYAANPGDKTASKSSSSWVYPGFYKLGSQPIHIMSNHELFFIKAEAALRLGDPNEDAQEAFETAVAQSVDEQSALNDECGMDPFTMNGATYAATLGKVTLKKLFEQKYLAGVMDEQVETYNDIRRVMGMGEGSPLASFNKTETGYINLTNPQNNISGVNRWPYLLPLGGDAVASNPNLQTVDIYKTKAWVFTKE